MQAIESIWREIAGEHPLPAPMLSLIHDQVEGYAILSPDEVSFGLMNVGISGLDALMQALPGHYDSAVVDAVVQQQDLSAPSARWGVEIAVRKDTSSLHIVAESRTPVADLADFVTLTTDRMAWPEGLARSGAVYSWSVRIHASGLEGFEVEAPANAAWIPPATHRALRDLPELGTVRVLARRDQPLRYESRALIGETDREACWEAAMIPLAAYGRADWVRLHKRREARPLAVRLNGEDARLEVAIHL